MVLQNLKLGRFSSELNMVNVLFFSLFNSIFNTYKTRLVDQILFKFLYRVQKCLNFNYLDCGVIISLSCHWLKQNTCCDTLAHFTLKDILHIRSGA